jgi:hypothetical protein
VLLSRGLLPGALTRRISAGADQGAFAFDFQPRGNLHPLLKVFADEQNSGLDTAQIFTYWQMDVRGDSKAQRVLNYQNAKGQTQNQDPAITVHQLGEGNIVVMTTTANAEWSSLPAKPAYVALMHELVGGSIDSGAGWMNRTVGDVLEVPASVKLPVVPTLSDPTQKEMVLQSVGGGAIAYRSSPLLRPGLYHLQTGRATIPIAVNPPSDESDIRTIDNGTIRKALGDIEMDLETDVLPPQLREAGAAGDDFGWPLMVAAMLFLCAECVMAMRFGHYRRG